MFKALNAKNKLGFVDRSLEKPSPDDPTASSPLYFGTALAVYEDMYELKTCEKWSASICIKL